LTSSNAEHLTASLHPFQRAAPTLTYLLFLYTEQTVALTLVVASDNGFAVLVMVVADDSA
jgi:hypothetical protein